MNKTVGAQIIPGLYLSQETASHSSRRPAVVCRSEPDIYLALIKRPDRGRAFLQIMRSTERTPPARQARYRAARDVPAR